MNFTVLIVDDESMPRKVLCDHLPWDELGITRVLQASDGVEAIDTARRSHPDTVITAIKMPPMSGLPTAAASREFHPGCQFIFLSGYSDKEYLKGAIKLKAASYVEKPIDLEEVEQALRDVIRDIQKSDSQEDERKLFFHGERRTDTPPGSKIFQYSQAELDTLSDSVKRRRETETVNILHKFYREIRRCEGTEPSYLRHFYRQIVYVFLNAAENCNITAITQNADYYLYTAAGQDTLAKLWDTLFSLSGEYFSAFADGDTDIASRVERYLEQNYTDCGLTVQDMARELGFTYTYLCAAYKKSCSKTINQRLTQLRVMHAKELLAGSGKKLYEVARSVGYADGKYFTKLFTRETGLSPKEYRERHRNEI